MAITLTPEEEARMEQDRDSTAAQVSALDTVLQNMQDKIDDNDLQEGIYVKFADEYRSRVLTEGGVAATRQDTVINQRKAPHVFETGSEFPPGSPTAVPGPPVNNILDWVVREALNGTWTNVVFTGPNTEFTQSGRDFTALGVTPGATLRIYAPSPSTAFTSFTVAAISGGGNDTLEVVGDVTSTPGAATGEDYTVEGFIEAGSDAFSNSNDTDPTQLSVMIALQDTWDSFARLLFEPYQGVALQNTNLTIVKDQVEQFRDDVQERGDTYATEFPP